MLRLLVSALIPALPYILVKNNDRLLGYVKKIE